MTTQTARLISFPSIYLIAQPSLVTGGIDQWAIDQGFADLANDITTPLGRIAHQSCDKSKADDINNDGEVLVEFAGRQCYGSFSAGRTNEAYIENVLTMGHGSVLAHAHYSFAITGVSRSLTHELVRHAAGCDYSQESQRFVDVSQNKFVVPPALLHLWGGDLECSDARDFLADNVRQVEAYNRWQDEVNSMVGDLSLFPLDPYLSTTSFLDSAGLNRTDDERRAVALRKRETMLRKRANESARAVMPNAAETKLVWTVNLRALRYILALRGATDADLEIRRFAGALALQCKNMAPATFADIEIHDGDFSTPSITALYHKV